MSDTNFKDIKVIGFDLDQTLYPKSPEIDAAIQKYIYEKISQRLNINLDSAKNKFTELYRGGRGLGSRHTLVTLGFAKEEAGDIVQGALEKADIAKFLHPNPKLTSLLSQLSRKYTLDIITGSNQKNTLQKLLHLEVSTKIFSHVITADESPKSDGTAYKLWLSQYPKHDLGEFLYIGDRPKTDYEIPKILGIKSILVNIKEADPNVRCLQLRNILEIETLL